MGIRIVIGPDSSAEVEAVKAYADENGILVICPSSTAISLAIPGDNVTPVPLISRQSGNY